MAKKKESKPALKRLLRSVEPPAPAAKATRKKPVVATKAPAAKPKLKPKAKVQAKAVAPKAQRPSKARGGLDGPSKTASKPARISKSTDAVTRGIDVGHRAPTFMLKDETGTLISSDSLRGAAYVIYFYPKDNTPGCTLEACAFRDSLPRFDAKGVKILGVSPDSVESHQRFRQKYGLNFTLLSDPEKKLANAYGVWVKKQLYGREYMGVERSTFYVDRRGVVQKVWHSVRVPGHVDALVHSV